ncbi:MAG: hypothetical protein LCH63_13230 [Candidatus Melainabacteria bacterium]|jgi:hypothetical protein|uniref:Uncharacterized protein n=1 Tax=Candidatus Obscuribacter phosphatis TaxID=1906157 RepID=A0A8J7PD51_9BACT|nr:hypothetical protein [Candidatus Obscuribacter phosphatis]MCA0314779.1 hypothetical protein [Candidatus Melainabacteria bacterium]
MDIPFYLASALLAGALLYCIAESDRLLHKIKPKSKKLSSGSWGVYDGVTVEESVGEVEVKPLGGRQKVIGGSATYAAGRGVRMNGLG